MWKKTKSKKKIHLSRRHLQPPPAITNSAVKERSSPSQTAVYWKLISVGRKSLHIKRIFALSPGRFFLAAPSIKKCSSSIIFLFRLRAKYFDPVTQLPFSTVQAFRILREAYCQQLEVKGDANDPEIARWNEWRQKFRQARNAALAAAARAQQAQGTTQTLGTQQQNPVAAVKPSN